MLSENRSLRRLGRKEIWGWPFAIFTFVFFSVLSLFSDLLLSNTWDIRWVAVNLITYIEVALLGWFLAITIVRFVRNAALIWANMFLAALLGSIKNYSVGLVSTWLGLPDVTSWQTRVVGGAVMGIGLLFFFSTVLGSRIEHSVAMAHLGRSRSALLNHRVTADALVDAERARLLSEAQASLLPRLTKIQEIVQSRGEIARAVDGLRDLITNQIRPMSRDLSRQAENLSSSTNYSTINPKFFVKYFSWNTLFLPAVPIGISLATNWMLVQIFFGAEKSYIGFVMSGITGLALLILKLLLPKKGRISRRNAIFFTPLLAMLFSLPGLFVGLLLAGDSPFRFTLLSHVVLIGLSAWGATYVEVLDSDRKVSEHEAEKDNEELKRELTLFDQQLWLARRNWGMVLHGTVQAAITAAITRLSAEENLEGYQYELINQDLNRALVALEEPPNLNIDLQQFTSELVATWAGICEVTWRFSERASRVLMRDRSARICVNEIAKEAVSNAVRHGNASVAKIELDRMQNDLIEMKISNDGAPPKAKIEKGVGSQMFDELTLEWSLNFDRVSARTVLSATFPISMGNLSS